MMRSTFSSSSYLLLIHHIHRVSPRPVGVVTAAAAAATAAATTTLSEKLEQERDDLKRALALYLSHLCFHYSLQQQRPPQC